jgi:hypothetical protein
MSTVTGAATGRACVSVPAPPPGLVASPAGGPGGCALDVGGVARGRQRRADGAVEGSAFGDADEAVAVAVGVVGRALALGGDVEVLGVRCAGQQPGGLDHHRRRVAPEGDHAGAGDAGLVEGNEVGLVAAVVVGERRTWSAAGRLPRRARSSWEVVAD